MSKSNSNRRQFLRNTTLLTIGATVVGSKVSKAEPEGEELCVRTTLDLYGQGPFYTANAPALSNGLLVDENEPGQRMIISGRVLNLDCTEVIPNAVIDIWHANDAGAYDNQGFNLRGKITTNSQGFYMFETIKPGKYLNGASFRPSHIHFKITPPGFSEITTQLYFEGDTDIPGDAAASVTSGQFDATSRIINLTENNDGKLEGVWDIIVDGEGEILSNDMHLNQGMIYSISPNPMVDELKINYGVFREADVTLQVFDLKGSLVADIENQQLSPEKYTAVWRPQSDLPQGYYFVILQLDNLQVHYLKVLKTTK
jgi:protocatechuate 3,4-dioxygenase beta subunit